ncbi:MAG: NfeD family protein [Chromatiales bacterium]|nr:NfeD family protein [Chromatiales bacterium]
MSELITGINHWHWWILGVALLALEVLAPGAFFLWMGISAVVVGLLLLALPEMGWEYQIFFFAIFSMASIFLWRRYFRSHPVSSDHPTLNLRGAQYIGRVFTLDEPIVNGLGKVRVDDSTWKISGEDCAAGSKVRVIGVDGVVFKVESVVE